MLPPAFPPPDPPHPARVADAFGLGRPMGPPRVAARGALGRIWRMETDRGPWAVKELLRYEEASVHDSARADVAFQDAALAAGVPMPRPVLTTSGDVLVDVGANGAPRLVRVYTWVELAGRDVRPNIADVAAILGRLHALRLADPRPLLEWFALPPPRDSWPAALDAAARARGEPWAEALVGLVPAVLELLAATQGGRRATLITCHLDFNPENVLVDVGGRPVVVDWENSGPGSPEQELASVLAEFVPDPAATPDFLAAYEAAGGPARLLDRSSFAMTAVVQANLVETYARWAADPAVPADDRAIAIYFLGDIAANVFTVERIDAWLAAAGARAG